MSLRRQGPVFVPPDSVSDIEYGSWRVATPIGSMRCCRSSTSPSRAGSRRPTAAWWPPTIHCHLRGARPVDRTGGEDPERDGPSSASPCLRVHEIQQGRRRAGASAARSTSSWPSRTGVTDFRCTCRPRPDSGDCFAQGWTGAFTRSTLKCFDPAAPIRHHVLVVNHPFLMPDDEVEFAAFLTDDLRLEAVGAAAGRTVRFRVDTMWSDNRALTAGSRQSFSACGTPPIELSLLEFLMSRDDHEHDEDDTPEGDRRGRRSRPRSR